MNRASQSGFSLMELMIGVTVGLIVLAGASTLMVAQIGDHRRLSLEVRTQQDVRALGELMTRELQLAGAWGAPEKGAWSESNPSPIANPYAALDLAEDGSSIQFYVSDTIPGGDGVENNVVTPGEIRGFRWDGRALLFRIGSGGWQPLTDPATLNVTNFSILVSTLSSPTPSVCQKACDGLADCPPRKETRNIRVRMSAQPANDARVKRDLDITVRNQAAGAVGLCRI